MGVRSGCGVVNLEVAFRDDAVSVVRAAASLTLGGEVEDLKRGIG